MERYGRCRVKEDKRERELKREKIEMRERG